MNIGDIVPGNTIGYKSSHKCMWFACPDCGKEQWVFLRNGKPQNARCASCAGKVAAGKRNQVGDRHPRWKGGRIVNQFAYVEVKLSHDSPYFAMAGKDGYVYEHRLVMAQHLGRCLVKAEEVHHVNGDKHDNRIENLELNGKSEHNRLYHADMKRLLVRIGQLEDQIRTLTAKQIQ